MLVGFSRLRGKRRLRTALARRSASDVFESPGAWIAWQSADPSRISTSPLRAPFSAALLARPAMVVSWLGTAEEYGEKSVIDGSIIAVTLVLAGCTGGSFFFSAGAR